MNGVLNPNYLSGYIICLHMFEVAIVGHRFVLYYISFVLIDVQSSQMLRTNVVQKGFHPFSLYIKPSGRY